MILIDTSVWIEFFRGKSRWANFVDNLLAENNVAVCGPILTEIYRGISSPKERSKVLPLLDGCQLLSQPPDFWQEAGLLGASLKKRGINVKTVDLLIATYALAHEISLLTLDSDFASMKKAGLPLNLVH